MSAFLAGTQAAAHLSDDGRPGYALATFDATPYGPEYLSIEAQEGLEWMVARQEDGGWALGRRTRDNTLGWFPASYWAPREPQQPAAPKAAAVAGLVASSMLHAGESAGSSEAISQAGGTPGSLEATSQAIGAAAELAASRPQASSASRSDAAVAAAAVPRGPPPRPQAERDDRSAAASGGAATPAPRSANFKAPPAALLASLQAQAVEPTLAPGATIGDDGCTGPAYEREFLLQIGFALVQLEERPPDILRIDLGPRPQGEAAHTARSMHEVVSTLVTLAGGQLKMGNCAAAILALGLMAGPHAKVQQEITAAVRTHPDLFVPLDDKLDVSKQVVALKN